MLLDLARQGVDTWEELDAWLAAGTSRAKRRRALPASSDGADGA